MLFPKRLAAVALLAMSACAEVQPVPSEARTCPQDGRVYHLVTFTLYDFAKTIGARRAGAAAFRPAMVVRNASVPYTRELEWHECEHLAGRDHDHGTREAGWFSEEAVPGLVSQILLDLDQKKLKEEMTQ